MIIIDYTNEVAEFLEKNGKKFEHSDYVGNGRHICVWEIPSNLKESFLRLYWKAWLDWDTRDGADEFPTLDKGFYLLNGSIDPVKGEYHFRMAGYDEDGFYCKGESGTHHCESYVSFYPVLWALVETPWNNSVRQEMFQTKSGTDFAGYDSVVVAFM